MAHMDIRCFSVRDESSRNNFGLFLFLRELLFFLEVILVKLIHDLVGVIRKQVGDLALELIEVGFVAVTAVGSFVGAELLVLEVIEVEFIYGVAIGILCFSFHVIFIQTCGFTEFWDVGGSFLDWFREFGGFCKGNRCGF